MNDSGKTVEHFFAAIEENDVEFVREFLKSPFKYDINDTNIGLSLAIRVGNVKLIQELFNSPKRPNLQFSDDLGRMPLHSAVMMGNLDVVDFIIGSGASVNRADNNGYRPLHLAAQCGHVDIINHLISKGAQVYSSRTADFGFTALHAAVDSKQTGAVIALLDSRLISVDARTKIKFGRCTPLHIAVKGGFYEGVTTLYELGADINAKDGEGRLPIHLAAAVDDKNILLFLIKEGADVNSVSSDGQRPIHYAAYANQAENAKILIMNNADIRSPYKNGYAPLYSAVLIQATDVVQVLLSAGVDPNYRTETVRKDTPLLMASSVGNVEIVELLLKAKADAALRGSHGTTALHRCQKMKRGDKRDKLIKLLIDSGAKLNDIDKDGYTPLHNCVYQTVFGNFSLSSMSLLIQAGAILQSKQNSGERQQGLNKVLRNSPLCWLVWRGYFEAAKYLLHCDWDVRDEIWMHLPGKSEEQTRLHRIMQENVHCVLPLANICRKVIRSHLLWCNNGRQILTNIDSLPLPKAMKEFLSLTII